MKALLIVIAGFYLLNLYERWQAEKIRRHNRKRFYNLYKINF